MFMILLELMEVWIMSIFIYYNMSTSIVIQSVIKMYSLFYILLL